MSGLQGRQKTEPTNVVDLEHQFTIRPESEPSAELSTSSFKDYEAGAIIAEFKTFTGRSESTAVKEISLLLDHIDQPAVRSFVIDRLKVSNQSQFEYSAVRVKIFEALGPYAAERDVQVVCVQEFRRRISDAQTCQAAYGALSKRTSWSGADAQEYCQQLILESRNTLKSGEIPPGVACALRAIGRSPDGTRVEHAVAQCISAYREGRREDGSLQVLMALGTDKALRAVYDIALERIAPRWSLSPSAHYVASSDDSEPGMGQYVFGSVLLGGAASICTGIWAARHFHHSNLLGWVVGLSTEAVAILLPTLIPAVYKALFKRHDVNPTMREQALHLLATALPNKESEEIVLKAMLEKGRAQSSKENLAGALCGVKNEETILRIADIIENGSTTDRMVLLNAFRDSTHPTIRNAIVKSKSDISIGISELAIKACLSWDTGPKAKIK